MYAFILPGQPFQRTRKFIYPNAEQLANTLLVAAFPGQHDADHAHATWRLRTAFGQQSPFGTSSRWVAHMGAGNPVPISYLTSGLADMIPRQREQELATRLQTDPIRERAAILASRYAGHRRYLLLLALGLAVTIGLTLIADGFGPYAFSWLIGPLYRPAGHAVTVMNAVCFGSATALMAIRYLEFLRHSWLSLRRLKPALAAPSLQYRMPITERYPNND